jgi:hypothetical protein
METKKRAARKATEKHSPQEIAARERARRMGIHEPVDYETFTVPHTTRWSGDTAPRADNGTLRVVKYRVRVEAVVEDDEVYAARIRGLWRACENHQHQQCLELGAEALGLRLDPAEYGIETPQGQRDARVRAATARPGGTT